MKAVDVPSRTCVFNLTFDDYIPVQAYAEPAVPQPLYWRVLDDRGLMEVGVDPRFGWVVSIVLTLVDPKNVVYSKSSKPRLPNATDLGLDLSLWPERDLVAKKNNARFRDEAAKLSLEIGDTHSIIGVGQTSPSPSLISPLDSSIAMAIDPQGEVVGFVLSDHQPKLQLSLHGQSTEV
ncbi:MAG: hypothetical protein AAFU77_16050 [Myxococcota bacterium]